MSGFNVNPLGLAVRSLDGRNVVLLEALVFQRPDSVGGQIITAPIGTTSDGASIPEILWSTGLTPWGPWWLAAIVHDAIYRKVSVPTIADRSVADLILYEAMAALCVPLETARLIYDGVRVGGQHAWDHDRK